jgi:hypothetical protein
MWSGLLWVSSPRATVGLVVAGGVVVESPPYGRRWAMGRRAWDINERLAGRAEVIWRGDHSDPYPTPIGRPDWIEWWLPVTCANGHPLGKATINPSFVPCPGCPATTDGRGHHIYRCRTTGCGAPFIPPPHHDRRCRTTG